MLSPSRSNGAPAYRDPLGIMSELCANYFTRFAKRIKCLWDTVTKVTRFGNRETVAGAHGSAIFDDPLDRDDARADVIRRYVAPTFEDLESFWRDGVDACSRRTFLKIPQHICCAGVDMPGLGLVHSADCAEAGRMAENFRDAQSVPEPLRSFVSDQPANAAEAILAARNAELTERIDRASGDLALKVEHRRRRDGLFAQLMHGAEALAARSITGLPRQCGECQMTEHCGRLKHAPSCLTGCVLGLAEALIADQDHTRKETATDEVAGGAGDGIRSRGLSDLTCIKCGFRGGGALSGWTWDVVPGKVDLSLLGLNQVAKRCGYFDSVIYTHDCSRQAARDRANARVDVLSAETAAAVVDDMLARGELGEKGIAEGYRSIDCEEATLSVEAWKTSVGAHGSLLILDQKRNLIAFIDHDDAHGKAWANRIVGCVNACINIPTPGLEGAIAGTQMLAAGAMADEMRSKGGAR